MRYTPGPVPQGIPQQARAWLADELRKVSAAIAEVDSVNLVERAAEPAKLADGLLAYADGANWNPGSGEGFYGRYAGAWNALGGGGGLDGTADEIITGNWTFEHTDGILIKKPADTETMKIQVGASSAQFDMTDIISVTFTGQTGPFNVLGDEIALRNTVSGGGPSQLTIGNGTAQANNSNDAKIIMYGEHNNTTYGVQLAVASSNFGIVGTSSGCDAAVSTLQFATNFQMTAGSDFAMIAGASVGTFECRDGSSFRVMDSTDSDYVNIAHDGIDLNITHVGTTDWNITGINAFNMVNYSFDCDQSLGASQDGYVLTYTDSTGLLSLKVNSGGGSGATVTFFQVEDDGTTGQATTTGAVDLAGMWGTPSLTDSDFSWNGTTGILTVNTAGTLELNVKVTTKQTAGNRHELHVQVYKNGSAVLIEDSNYASRNATQSEGSAYIVGFKDTAAANDTYRIRVYHAGVAASVGVAGVAGQTYLSATLFY